MNGSIYCVLTVMAAGLLNEASMPCIFIYILHDLRYAYLLCLYIGILAANINKNLGAGYGIVVDFLAEKVQHNQGNGQRATRGDGHLGTLGGSTMRTVPWYTP